MGWIDKLTKEERAYYAAEADKVRRQIAENPDEDIHVDPDVADYMGAMEHDDFFDHEDEDFIPAVKLDAQGVYHGR